MWVSSGMDLGCLVFSGLFFAGLCVFVVCVCMCWCVCVFCVCVCVVCVCVWWVCVCVVGVLSVCVCVCVVYARVHEHRTWGRWRSRSITKDRSELRHNYPEVE